MNILDKVEKIKIKKAKNLKEKQDELVNDLIKQYANKFRSTEELLKSFYFATIYELEKINKE